MEATGEYEGANKREPPDVVPGFAADEQQRSRYKSIAKSIIAAAVNQAAAEVNRAFAIKTRELQIAVSAAETSLAIAERDAHGSHGHRRIRPHRRTSRKRDR